MKKLILPLLLFMACEGAVGPQGMTGPQGPQGPQGLPGQNGVTPSVIAMGYWEFGGKWDDAEKSCIVNCSPAYNHKPCVDGSPNCRQLFVDGDWAGLPMFACYDDMNAPMFASDSFRPITSLVPSHVCQMTPNGFMTIRGSGTQWKVIIIAPIY
jgi:hypothetical protein